MNTDLNNVYSNWSEDYDNYAKKHNMATAKVHRYFKELVGEATGKIGLDLGCGTGLVTKLVAENAKKVIGLDINRAMLDQAKKKYKNDRNLEFFEADISKKLNFSNESFDFIISSLALSHIENVEPIFKEVYRVLKKNGIFVFDEPDAEPRTPLQLQYKPEPRIIDPLLKYKREGGKVWHSRNLGEELQMLKRIGFKIDELIEVKYDEEIKNIMKNYKYHKGRTFFNIIKAVK